MAGKSPLTLPVRDLIGHPGQMREQALETVAPERYGEAVAVVPEGAPVTIALRLESVHEGILASGVISTTAEAQCVRCLEPVDFELEAEFQELFAYSGQDGYDYQVVDETIDLDQVVRDQVVLELPFQPVCSDDCPGLDPETGHKRPDGWQPPAEKGIDPRWAALEKLAGDAHEDPGPAPR